MAPSAESQDSILLRPLGILSRGFLHGAKKGNGRSCAIQHMYDAKIAITMNRHHLSDSFPKEYN